MLHKPTQLQLQLYSIFLSTAAPLKLDSDFDKKKYENEKNSRGWKIEDEERNKWNKKKLEIG